VLTRAPTAPALGLLTVLLSVAALPQRTNCQPYDPLGQAARLEAAGEYWAAAASLRAYLWSHPDDATVRWPLGRLLYWLGRPDQAMAEYEAAMAALPDEPWLRIDRAAILMDRLELRDAEKMLEQALDLATSAPAAATEARTRLGALAYWRGDFSTAARLFADVLSAEPDREEVRRQLEEIRSTMRSWVQVGGELRSDNQPFRRVKGDVEAGLFLDPLWTASVGLAPHALDVPGASVAAEGWIGLQGYLPGPKVDLGLTTGRVWQDGLAGADGAWTGAADVAVRLHRGMKVRGRAWAARNVWTLASADTLVMVRGVEVALDRAIAAEWAWEAVARIEGMPGDNAIRTIFGWALAPLLPWLRAGYAFSWQDSEQTRWTLVEAGDRPGGPGPGGPGGTTTPTGRYTPYFTPEATSIHSLLGEFKAPLGMGTGRLSFSLGFRAVEQAPSLITDGVGPTGTVRTVFTERHFTPWNVTAVTSWPAGCCVDLRVEAELGRTAFYRSSRMSVVMVYRPLRATLPRTP